MTRPKVVLWGVVSVDGRLTVAPGVLLLYGDERWDTISGSSIYDTWEWLKSVHHPQVILEGSGSLVRPGEVPEPLPPVEGDPSQLYQNFLPLEIVNRPGRTAWFTVVDSGGRVRWVYKEMEDQYLLVLVARETPPEYLAYLQRETIPYLVVGEERVDLESALELLGSRLGVTCVMSSSPGRLGGALLRAGLVDEVNVEFLPAVIGGKDTPTLFDSPELGPDEWPTRLRLLSAQTRANGRVWLRYEVLRNDDRRHEERR